MALKTAEIDKEIKKLTSLRNMNDGKITKAVLNIDKLKKNQSDVVDKLKQLQVAKVNLTKFNKAG